MTTPKQIQQLLVKANVEAAALVLPFDIAAAHKQTVTDLTEALIDTYAGLLAAQPAAPKLGAQGALQDVVLPFQNTAPKWLADAAGLGGRVTRKRIWGAQGACISNNGYDNGLWIMDPVLLELKDVEFLPSQQGGTYWGGRAFGISTHAQRCTFKDLGGDPTTGKQEGHAWYVNPGPITLLEFCRFERCAASSLQGARRPWERGHSMEPELFALRDCELIEMCSTADGDPPSERAGFTFASYGLSPRCVSEIVRCKIVQTEAAHDFQGAPHYSYGILSCIPVTDPADDWTGPAAWWTKGNVCGRVARIDQCDITMRRPSQETMFVSAHERVEFTRNNLNIYDGLGRAMIWLDPMGADSVSTCKELIVAGNTGTPIPIRRGDKNAPILGWTGMEEQHWEFGPVVVGAGGGGT